MRNPADMKEKLKDEYTYTRTALVEELHYIAKVCAEEAERLEHPWALSASSRMDSLFDRAIMMHHRLEALARIKVAMTDEGE